MSYNYFKSPKAFKQFFVITGQEPFKVLGNLQGTDLNSNLEDVGKMYDILVGFGLAMIKDIPLPDKKQAYTDYLNGEDNKFADYITEDEFPKIMAALSGVAPSKEEIKK